MNSLATPELLPGRRSELGIDHRVERLVSFGRAVGHPSRARILVACAEAEGSLRRPVALARELGLPLGVVSYHVRALAGLGLLVLRSTATVRGAVAHDYAVAAGVTPALHALTGAVALDDDAG